MLYVHKTFCFWFHADSHLNVISQHAGPASGCLMNVSQLLSQPHLLYFPETVPSLMSTLYIFYVVLCFRLCNVWGNFGYCNNLFIFYCLFPFAHCFVWKLCVIFPLGDPQMTVLILCPCPDLFCPLNIKYDLLWLGVWPLGVEKACTTQNIAQLFTLQVESPCLLRGAPR